jgi:hypothetical protein
MFNRKAVRPPGSCISSPVPVTVPAIVVSGTAFSLAAAIPNPLVIPGHSTYSFTIRFAPNNPTPFTGALTIGPQSVGLTGIGYEPPFPAVSLTF